ncbi:hypothetical protein GCM10008994_31380 [Halorubrum ejinorense]|uniref:Uncharacterized protein n=1 Tax=Halorubrum ejinorense TaxID=425309 RepID=A0AAV3SWB3_9EURY
MLLPSRFEQPDDTSDEELEVTRSILAQQYVEHTNIGPLWKSTLILLIYDFGFELDAVVYGLVIGALGSVELAVSNFYTPEILAEEVILRSDNLKSEIETKAKRTVKTNVGVTGLVVGFVWQILTISGPIPDELLAQGYLRETLPSWLGFVICFSGVLLVVSVISKITDYF